MASSKSSAKKQIKGLFDSHEVNSAGIYLVNIYYNGYKVPVIIDDFLPVIKGTTKLAFAHS